MTSTQGKGLSANVLPGMKHMSGIGAAMLVHEGVNRLGRAQEHDRVLDCVSPEARELLGVRMEALKPLCGVCSADKWGVNIVWGVAAGA